MVSRLSEKQMMHCQKCGYVEVGYPEQFVNEMTCPECGSYGFFLHDGRASASTAKARRVEPVEAAAKEAPGFWTRWRQNDVLRKQVVTGVLIAALTALMVGTGAAVYLHQEGKAAAALQAEQEAEQLQTLRAQYRQRYTQALKGTDLTERARTLGTLLTEMAGREGLAAVQQDVAVALSETNVQIQQALRNELKAWRAEQTKRLEEERAALAVKQEELAKQEDAISHKARLKTAEQEATEDRLDRLEERLRKREKEALARSEEAEKALRDAAKAVAEARKQLAEANALQAKAIEKEAQASRTQDRVRRREKELIEALAKGGTPTTVTPTTVVTQPQVVSQTRIIYEQKYDDFWLPYYSNWYSDYRHHHHHPHPRPPFGPKRYYVYPGAAGGVIFKGKGFAITGTGIIFK